MSTEMGLQQVRDLSHTEASKMQMVFSYWGKWQTLKHHLCIFCNISWKWWEPSSFIHALTRDIWRRTKSCRKGWVMRSRGKMICHAVRWCSWYFTIIQRYSPLRSSKNVAAGGGQLVFPTHLSELGLCSPSYLASLTFPSALLEKHEPHRLSALSFLQWDAELFHLHLLQEIRQGRNPPPAKGRRKGTAPKAGAKGWEAARRVPPGTLIPQPPAEWPNLTVPPMPQSADEANKSPPTSAFHIKLRFIYLQCI